MALFFVSASIQENMQNSPLDNEKESKLALTV